MSLDVGRTPLGETSLSITISYIVVVGDLGTDVVRFGLALASDPSESS